MMEIPITTYTNLTLFADPITIKTVKWFLHRRWQCCYPKLQEFGNPDTLNVSTDLPMWNTSHVRKTLIKSMFTPDQLEKYQQNLNARPARLPAQQHHANIAPNSTRNNGYLGSFIDATKMQNIQVGLSDTPFGSSGQWGWYYLYTIEFLYAILIIKTRCFFIVSRHGHQTTQIRLVAALCTLLPRQVVCAGPRKKSGHHRLRTNCRKPS